MNTKICNCCKIEKDINDYHNHKKFIDNKHPTCKECVKTQSKKYYTRNREIISLKGKEIRKTEDHILKRNKYLTENKEKIRETNKEYKLKRRELILIEKKDYYNRKKNDPIFALTKRLRAGIYRSLRGTKLKASLDILGCTQEEFKTHIENQFTEGMSWNRLGEIHIDHIIPISFAETIDDLYKLNYYTNLQPLWAKDNLVKYNKIINL